MSMRIAACVLIATSSAIALASCSAFVDFSDLTGGVDADAEDATLVDASDSGSPRDASDTGAPLDASDSGPPSDASAADAAASCSAGSCGVGEVCCVPSSSGQPLPQILAGENGKCVNTSDCVSPDMPLGCGSPYYCESAGFGASTVCCVSHDKTTSRFISTACVAFDDCITSGPQDILCDVADASTCVAPHGDAASAACAPVGLAGDGTNFGNVAICR